MTDLDIKPSYNREKTKGKNYGNKTNIRQVK